MREYVTEAIVLAMRPARSEDRLVKLFTKDLGRLEARVVGGRRPLSRVAPHLNPWDQVTVRLVRKQAFTIADAVALTRAGRLRSNRRHFFTSLELLYAVHVLTTLVAPDLHLWYFLTHLREQGIPSRRRLSALTEFLQIMGYDPSGADCLICGARRVVAFILIDQAFVCAQCATKFERNALLSIS